MEELKTILNHNDYDKFVDWLNEEVLDIEYSVDSEKNYKSAEIYLSLGGPACWIDTCDGTYYDTYSDEYQESKDCSDWLTFTQKALLNDWMREVFECL